jgi:hypothetical protein
MDEQPVHSIKETKTPIEPTLEHARHAAYEHQCAGTADVFMVTKALAVWREAAVRERNTTIDRAIAMARLLEGRYADCEKVIVLSDNCNRDPRAFRRSFPAGKVAATRSPHLISSRTQTRQLAEHCQKRVGFADPPPRRGSTPRKHRNPTRTDRSLLRCRQLNPVLTGKQRSTMPVEKLKSVYL